MFGNTVSESVESCRAEFLQFFSSNIRFAAAPEPHGSKIATPFHYSRLAHLASY